MTVYPPGKQAPYKRPKEKETDRPQLIPSTATIESIFKYASNTERNTKNALMLRIMVVSTRSERSLNLWRIRALAALLRHTTLEETGTGLRVFYHSG
jgi:hypothetical protein